MTEDSDIPLSEAIPAPTRDPGVAIDAHDLLQAARPREREALLEWACGHSQAEIGARLGMTRAGAHQICAKGLQRARRRAQGGMYGC